jgi:hypothetical protein
VKRLALGAALALSGCVKSQVLLPPEDAAHAMRTLAGEERYLRVSMYVTPFFGDSTHKFLSPLPPEFVDLVDNPDGTPVKPSPVERITPAGTPVRIVKLELPSDTILTERVLFTPRSLAWVYLDVGDTAKGAPPELLVLRPGLTSERELDAELAHFLSREDPQRKLEGWPEAVREAIKAKKAVLEMPAEALEMAWGPPERRKLELDGDKHRETWFWGNGRRQAVLLDGRVTQLP